MLPRHVYVHVPFCARRCVYCDFSIAVRRDVPVDDYIAAIAAEMSVRFAVDQPWSASTLYLGGGTPSRLGADGIGRLMDVLTRRVTLADDAEVTLEANPDDVSDASTRAWYDAGINRLSLGVQSFDDEALRWMHRTHDAAQVPRAVDAARRAGIEDMSVDLIFSLPEHLNRSWQDDLQRALALQPTHVSLYGLTVEPHTPLGRWRERGDIVESPDERYESDFLTAHDVLAAAGFEHYEVSNFARPGKRARHNTAYWRRVPYVGIGPSAHGFDGQVRRWNQAAYVEWARRAAAGSDPIAGSESLDTDDVAAEDAYLGLRTAEGLRIDDGEREQVAAWVEQGWARLEEPNHLVLTPSGWLRLDALTATLTVERSRYYV